MKKRIKNFFDEFKKFITRGNVLDMAVGVIVGGAFTGIVNALSNNILKPIINALLALVLGKEGLSGAITMLSPAYKDILNDQGVKIGSELDLASSIYIDWGAFISAIINFFLIAIVLFSIVRMFNRIREANEKLKLEIETEKAAVKKYRKDGLKKKQAVEKYRQELKAVQEKAAAEQAAKEAEEKRLAEEKELANTRLLDEIRDLLKIK